MRTTYPGATVRLSYLDCDSAGGGAQTLLYAPLDEALVHAAQQPDNVQAGLFIATDNDVVGYLDLVGE